MKTNGFTLLEVIFILGIWSLLILLSLPIQFSLLDKQEAEQFFRTFESDLLYMQNMSFASDDNFRLSIDAENNRYTIYSRTNEKVIERTIPKEWKIDKRTLQKPISFNKLGTIRTPGTLEIITKKQEYKIIFPLGKGRYYIAE
ncbi:competence type IV pilus minor pilin ComGD [Lentibacillus sp. Marseille-P4043]|uniref:competence type IV pilus minor pilin ComGD n=1 Tax=Lentibacillus sp. Marseille-P4043 TaxID=2040293 RepID=UPI000D0B5632|nr:competence type IV pilus minor pilin ComGD [Lentibacillus sp. Marseille-P4043]